jgi:hypothetical protein
VEWEVFILMTHLNPLFQWMRGHTCFDEDFIRITSYLEVFVAEKMQNEDMQNEETQLATHSRMLPIVPKRWSQQQNRYPGAPRGTPVNSAPFTDWFHSSEELTHLSDVTAKCLTLLTMSGSMERQFSVARHVATDLQMAKLPETLVIRVLIHANW